MLIKTNVAKVMEEVNHKVKYDTAVKKVLSDPQILSWILKYTVSEFNELSIPEIMACIQGKPEVGIRPLHPGHYTVSVEGDATELSEVAAQKVVYDIRFRVVMPGSGPVGMMINVEAQKKFYESYDLVSRGVFYCARMLSTQIRNEESATEYNNLQKVYSIWICLEVPVNSEYSITCYHMNKKEIFGHMASTVNQRYDLMELVMICLGKPEDVNKGTELHKLLTVVLSDKLAPKEKISAMQEEFDIVTTVELEGGLAKMCNLSEYIEERAIERGMQKGMQQGMQQGMQKGMQQGMQQGMQKGIYKTLFSLVSQGCISMKKAAQEAGVALKEFKALYQESQKVTE